MVKGLTYYLRQAWKKPDTALLRERMFNWRSGDTIIKVDKPLRLDRARALGYKAKKGVIVVRARVKRGGHTRKRAVSGRKTKGLSVRKNLMMNYRQIAEQRAGRKYPNCEVLNSYWIGKDGLYFYFEVILVDRNAPEIKADKQLSFIAKCMSKGRVYHGVTSAGKRARGLRS
jgi:large subunit ribosomal protein L15e